ncbi:uncharacterized protein [Dysidea avara]|uniref:uncharacterized protein n=1 Tax=Dysidea avara TaxID=196820 RepID=UPI003332B134
MPPGCPRTGRATYAFVRLREETHKLWLEAKRSLAASSDDALACCLLQNIRRNIKVTDVFHDLTDLRDQCFHHSSDLSVVAGQHRCDDLFLCSTPVHSSTRNESRLVSSDRRGERLKHPVLFRAEEEESSSDCEATPQLQQECNRQAEDSTLTSVSIIDHPSTMLADGYWQQSNWQAEESTLTSVSTIDYSSTMLAEESSQQSGSVCTSDEIRTVQNASYILNGTSSESDDDTTSECSSGSEDVEEELESNEISVQGIEGANIKVLCNLDKLLMLFSGKCHKPGCVENCSIAKYKVIGCCVLIHSQCTNKHIFVWKSSEMLTSRTNNKLFQNNLLFASAIILSGQSYYKIADFANVLGLSVSSSSSFHCYQRHYICPGIEVFFNAEQDKLLSTYRGKRVVLAADGRCDSPGNSAKYCTYSLMDHETNKILHVETVDKREVRLQSPNMEREAFSRSIAHVLQLVECPEVITDASSSVRKMIETQYPQMLHSLDVWHKSKKLKKALAEAGKRKGMDKLLKWSSNIVNHFWYCCRTSNGDVQILKIKWSALLHHVIDEHQWLDGRCEHDDLTGPPTDGDGRVLQYFRRNEPSFIVLQKLIMDPKWLESMKYYTKFW